MPQPNGELKTFTYFCFYIRFNFKFLKYTALFFDKKSFVQLQEWYKANANVGKKENNLNINGFNLIARLLDLKLDLDLVEIMMM